MHAYDFAYVGFSGGISTRASPASPGNLWHLSAEESQAEGSTEVGQWEACDKVLTYSYQVKIFCQFCQFFVKLCESLGNPVLHSIPEASFKHKSTSPGKSPATTYASKVHCGTMRNRFTASPSTSGSFDSFRVRFCSFDSSVASELCDAAKPAAQTNRLRRRANEEQTSSVI